MKPTSIFTTQEHFMQYHNSAAKKKGLNNVFSLATTPRSQPAEESVQQNAKTTKLQFFEREDKNHALSQILARECQFQEALVAQAKEVGEPLPQEALKLHFIQSEQVTEIPEDYTFFL